MLATGQHAVVSAVQGTKRRESKKELNKKWKKNKVKIMKRKLRKTRVEKFFQTIKIIIFKTKK